MKNIILSLIIIIALPGLSRAQKRDVPRVNFEFGGGMNFGAAKRDAQEVDPGATLYIEGRYNPAGLPVDAAFQIDISAFIRKWANGYEKRPRSIKFTAIGDYNFHRGSLVNPFVGMGIGIALDEDDFDDHGASPHPGVCLMPRVGLRLLKHVSVTLDYEISRVSHNHFDLKMGFYF
jgi:hypothetical protein